MIDVSDFALAGRFTVQEEPCFFEAPHYCQRIPERMQPIAIFFFDFTFGIAFSADLIKIVVQPI